MACTSEACSGLQDSGISSDLTAPTQEGEAKLKHLPRYVNGTKDFVQRLRPAMTLSSSDCARVWIVMLTQIGQVVTGLGKVQARL